MMWLVPVSAFPLIAALYLGGGSLAPEKISATRELLGVLATFVLFFFAWMAIQRGLDAIGTTGFAAALATVACGFLFPLLARVGFLVAGDKLHTVHQHH